MRWVCGSVGVVPLVGCLWVCVEVAEKTGLRWVERFFLAWLLVSGVG